MSGLVRAISRNWPSVALSAAFVVVNVSACSSFDPGLLNNTAGTKADPGLDGGRAGSSAVDPDSGAAGSAGSSGMGGGAGAGGTGVHPDGCYPNPDTEDEVCKSICPETCNGIDDDCNRRIDDGAANADCELNHASSVCNRGTCVIVECSGGFADCNDTDSDGCEAPRDDVNNCGTCGKKCTYVNGSGACVNDKCTTIACADGWDNCDNNAKDCETATDQLDNCSACDTVCENVDHASPSCETGVCGPGACEEGFGDCDHAPQNGCEEPLTSNVDCGKCDTECAFPGSTPSCATGTCLAIGCENDGIDFGECNGSAADGCESLNTPERCGACNKKCNDTLDHVDAATCTNKVCAIDLCEAGWGNCDSGDTQTGCETPLNSLSNCAECGTSCDRNNAVPTCTTGSCKIQDCDTGFDDCNDTDSDGCETSLNTNDDCGSCDATCTGGRTCSGGACSAVDCSMPPHNTTDCNGAKCGNCDHTNDGDCETDLAVDINNCGTCGNACAFNVGVTPHGTLACAAQACKVTCAVGFADCNGNYRDGCEQALNTLSNCDACGAPCAIANAAAKCTTFTAGHYKCEVATCNANFSDCDNNGTSCETALNTTSNCNTCSNTCNLANAVDACTGSTGNWACSIASCDQTYFKNCNSMTGDGCEVDSRSNVSNCGACNNNCMTHANVTSALCTASACAYTCASGFKDCSSTPGCETDVRTLANCGMCGVMCLRNNATATCSTGSCAIATCNTGFGKCDGNDANGCESLKTLTDCGGCGVLCAAPNGTASCSTGSCVRTGCNAGFDDCNGGLDCERNITAPGPSETGGMGPCMPDTGCTLVHNATNNHDYYFCTTARTAAAARTQCQSQRFGDLVRIDDDAENSFVATNMASDAWIGAGDSALEGAWRWSSDTQQFWSGTFNGGVAVSSRFNKWNTGEPNDSAAAEDCAQIIKAGANATKWNDLSCTSTLGFVCEVQLDACLSDVTKQSAMQCGCGVPDVHTDNDGFANCVDGCPSDGAKSVPGQCGCGMPDVFTDADSAADCVDACPTDPLKSANTGQCGCNNADTDSDGDLVADCVDLCDYDTARSALPCSYSYPPSNFNPTSPTNIFTGAQNVVCSATATFDTNVTTAITFCGATITPVIRTQAGGPELWIIPMNAFTLNAGITLRFTGARPAVLAVANDAIINGTIDVGGQLAVPGAGGNVSCAVGTGQGADATHDGDGNDGDGGGGGGAFGTVGAAAGNGDDGSGGGAGGAVSAIATLVPLRGGCRGGASTAGGNVNGAGAGGGAIQLAIGGRLTVSSTAVLAAAGGGGTRGGAAEDGGGGGGSGGAIFLEAKHLSIDPNAWITANGGGGAGGNATNSAAAGNGSNGGNASTARAAGGGFDDAGGNDSDGGGGGQGAAFAGAATNGSNAADKTCNFSFLCDDGGGGGGGGGGVGRVRIHGLTAGGCTLTTTRQSPLASTACP